MTGRSQRLKQKAHFSVSSIIESAVSRSGAAALPVAAKAGGVRKDACRMPHGLRARRGAHAPLASPLPPAAPSAAALPLAAKAPDMTCWRRTAFSAALSVVSFSISTILRRSSAIAGSGAGSSSAMLPSGALARGWRRLKSCCCSLFEPAARAAARARLFCAAVTEQATAPNQTLRRAAHEARGVRVHGGVAGIR